MDGKNETGGTGEEVLSSEFWVLSWQSGRECEMWNVECRSGTGEEVLSQRLRRVLSCEFWVLS